MPDLEVVSQAKTVATASLMAKPNVVGVGYGYKEVHGEVTDELCVVALVQVKVPDENLLPEERVPKSLGAVATDVRQVGVIRALQDRTDRWRPAPGGVSIGHFMVTAGTLGAPVRDKATGTRLILSNNHVLANSNNAKVGDAILQPGAIDGGKVDSDTIAHLARFVEIQFNMEPPSCGLVSLGVAVVNGTAGAIGFDHRIKAYAEDPQAINTIDAAVAQPVRDEDLMDEILDIGEISGTTDALLGMSVRKSGRTTGFTTGAVSVLGATIQVSYGQDRTAIFEGQIVTSAMSQGGDSGSLLVAGDSQQAVGLLFAGSAQATIHNPIEDVLEGLSLEI